ncbi:mechanosensitive ion channel family protein [Putridiphycobacter roseus]|uniref:Mechanosensitive ion channel family protein n=1 Tax=Putridiphycobacter roseus TaxID=2219161 RepID=A0A2W1MVY0_9FLAO|nr:mechanosensitive ion channel domain-containing protein [Putridiphycobacter roseus]PZE16259.1 mechanosensitive ion channel family protein [Putridiphycobacter roseus]
MNNLLIVEPVTGSISTFLNSIMSGIGDWGLKLMGGIAALIIGLWLIRLVMKAIGKAFDVRHIDESLKPFLLTIIAFGLKFLLFISIAGIIGVPTASFAALVAGIGIAIGAAFNGSLGHLASGVMILIFRPFKIGDLVEIDGTLGTVKEISVFVTILETFQNKTEIIPNGTITDGKITNITKKGELRVDMFFNIRYNADLKKAKTIIEKAMADDQFVMNEHPALVKVNNLTESTIELIALPYAKVANYWEVYWGTREHILLALSEAGFEAPHPQRVVTMNS